MDLITWVGQGTGRIIDDGEANPPYPAHIQEEILFCDKFEIRRDHVKEREVRPIAAIYDWKEQTRMWTVTQSNCPAVRNHMFDAATGV